MKNNFNISKMNFDDLEIIKPVLEDDFDNYWNYNILKDELGSSNSIYLVAKNTSNNEIVGFAGIKLIVDEAEIMNIVVKKSYRNLKIGSLLLENLILLCKTNNISSIFLVLDVTSSQRRLYMKYTRHKMSIAFSLIRDVDRYKITILPITLYKYSMILLLNGKILYPFERVKRNIEIQKITKKIPLTPFSLFIFIKVLCYS